MRCACRQREGIGASTARACSGDEERWQRNGLGLSIVKNIVEGHGGTIAFQSRVGQGTTFFITLPIEKERP